MARSHWRCSWCDPECENNAAVVTDDVNFGICDDCLTRCLADVRRTRARRDTRRPLPGRRARPARSATTS
ncbi:MAG: hypothetical protein AAF430_06110 [Myxococcota bacterium]